MSGDLTLKGPAALIVLLLLAVSLTINVITLTRKPQAVTVPVQVGGAAGAAMPVLPSGEANPLTHVPKGPGDAMGMPDATGGAGQ